jgi:hypothetical protein
MSSRRVSLIHSFSMFQTSTESPSDSSLYQSSSSVKPPIFTSCHSIAPRRTSKDMLNNGDSTSLMEADVQVSVFLHNLCKRLMKSQEEVAVLKGLPKIRG